MSTLTVLSETTNIAPYLAKNGLFPTNIFYRTVDILSSIAFADEDTLYLIIIHGFTRFSVAELFHLFEEMRFATDQGATVVVMSDVIIKSPALHAAGVEFVHYTGDLFFGKYEWYSRKWNISRDTEAEDAKIAEIMNYRAPENAKNTSYRKDFWAQFAEFTTPIKPFEGELPAFIDQARTSDSKYMEQILTLDLYNTHNS